MQLLWGNCYNSESKLSLFLASKIVFQHRFLLLASVGSVIGRLKRMYQSPTPQQTPCVIQNIYSGWLSWRCLSVCHASLVFRVRVLGLGFSVKVRIIVSVTGSGSYLNENFVLFSVCGAIWWVWLKNLWTENSLIVAKFPSVGTENSAHNSLFSVHCGRKIAFLRP